MISKEAIRDVLVRAVEYGHITKEDLAWFDDLFTPTPLDSKVVETILSQHFPILSGQRKIIRQTLQSYQSQLNQVREETNQYARLVEIVTISGIKGLLPEMKDKYFELHNKFKQILGDDANE